MKLLGFRAFRIWIALAVLIGALFLWSFGQNWYRETYPDAAFESITGRPLPPGVHATAYMAQMNDALWHTTHYWKLSGSISNLHQVIAGTDFVPAEHTNDVMEHIASQFGLDRSAAQVAAAFEWDEMRPRYYFILKDGTEAFYLH